MEGRFRHESHESTRDAVCCSVSQCVAVFYSALQCVAVRHEFQQTA